jgi:RNA polymerase sigma-70 factor, ECF subfamily
MTTAAMATRIHLTQGDDGNLAARLIGGEARAFDEVVAVYQQRVARLAYRLLGRDADLDDVVQEVFVVVFQKARRFRGDCSIWTWLTTITLNECRSRRRRMSLFRRLRWRVVKGNSEPSADRGAIENERERRVRGAIDELADRDREVIVLHYLEGFRTAEIATMLGATANTIEVRLHRARQKLKLILADVSEEFEHG